MMKAGTETGSLMNHVMSRGETKPEVGMGATILMWTDRKAGTIIKVTPTQVHVQVDKATRTDTNGMSESQEYAYERDTNGAVYVFRMTKRGYRCNGNGLGIGYRRAYHDYSF
jgi:hypothetical protein